MKGKSRGAEAVTTRVEAVGPEAVTSGITSSIEEPSFAPDFVPPEPSFAPPEPSIAPEPSFASPPPPPDSGMDGGMVFASVDEPAADMGAMDMPSPEHMSSALDAFHRKWQAELLAKDEAETSAKLAAVASARAELEKAETERQALREANMTKNRSEEQVRTQARGALACAVRFVVR